MLTDIIASYQQSCAIDYGVVLIIDPLNTKANTVNDIVSAVSGTKKNWCVVFPHEWLNKSDQIISHARSYKDNDFRVVYARKCIVKPIQMSRVRQFCHLYHIQGSNKLGIVGWGLFYNDELLGILSLGRHSRLSESPKWLFPNQTRWTDFLSVQLRITSSLAT